MRYEALGKVERRRRWSASEKLAAGMASLEPDAVMSEVARRSDVTRQQVYDWRRAARQGGLGRRGGRSLRGRRAGDECPEAEAETARISRRPGRATTAAGTASPLSAAVEIGLAGGRLPRVPVGLPTAELQRLMGAVDGA